MPVLVVTMISAHFQVLQDGQPGKYTAAFGHHGDTLRDQLVRLVLAKVFTVKGDRAVARTAASR